MKKLFMLANIYDSDKSIGITKKVHQQMQAFRRLGYSEILYTSYFDDYIGIVNFNTKEIVYKSNYIIKKKSIQKFTKSYELKKVATVFFKETTLEFDLLYSRYIFFDHFYLQFLKSAQKSAKSIVLEAHSYPIYNMSDYIYYPIYAMDKLYSRSCVKYIDLVAAISDKKDLWKKKTITIDNGINASDYKLKNIKSYNKQINLIFVGYEYNVHGIERLLGGLYDYYKTDQEYDVKLLLVGKILESTKNKIKKLNLHSRVVEKGILFGEKLDNVFELADIGIGVLAPYKRNSSLGTGLKTKEYLARGLPICIAGQSLTTPADFKYVLQLKNDGSNVDIGSIIEFYDILYKEKGFNKDIKEFSNSLNWDNQLLRIINVIEGNKDE